jgi:hypothetical protein
VDIFTVLLSGLIPNTVLPFDFDAFLLLLAIFLRLFDLAGARLVSASSFPSLVSVLSETSCRVLLGRLAWGDFNRKPPTLGIL